MNKIKLLVFFFFFSALGFSQEPDSTGNPPPAPPNRNKPPHHGPNAQKAEEFWKKVYWGGNVALSFGSGSGYYEISPNAGYKFNDIFSVGPQVIYQNYTFRSGNMTYNYNIVGGGVFARALIIPMIFLQAEYDILSVPDSYSLLNTKRAISDEKLVGLGLRNSWGNSFSYYITLLYDVNPTRQSPYYYLTIPIVTRAGFNVNF